jgi:hypothetical protein
LEGADLGGVAFGGGVEIEFAFLDELENGGAGDWFGG